MTLVPTIKASCFGPLECLVLGGTKNANTNLSIGNRTWEHTPQNNVLPNALTQIPSPMASLSTKNGVKVRKSVGFTT